MKIKTLYVIVAILVLMGTMLACNMTAQTPATPAPMPTSLFGTPSPTPAHFAAVNPLPKSKGVYLRVEPFAEGWGFRVIVESRGGDIGNIFYHTCVDTVCTEVSAFKTVKSGEGRFFNVVPIPEQIFEGMKTFKLFIGTVEVGTINSDGTHSDFYEVEFDG